MSLTIHFHQDDDGPAATVADVEAAKWQIAEWLPDENGRHNGDDPKNTWAKDQLVVEERDGKTFITMPEHTYTEKVPYGPFFKEVKRELSAIVWRLEEVA